MYWTFVHNALHSAMAEELFLLAVQYAAGDRPKEKAETDRMDEEDMERRAEERLDVKEADERGRSPSLDGSEDSEACSECEEEEALQ